MLRHRFFRRLPLAAVLVATAFTAQAQYTTVDLSGVANARFSDAGFINGSGYPVGSPLVLDGVPYRVPASGNHMWHSADSYHGGSGGTRSVTIPVNAPAGAVYTLMGTFWGETVAGTFASITFTGSAGAVHTVALDGGAEIRDYNFNPSHTTTFNTAVTREVWANGAGPGSQHIDRQLFDLPAAFDSQSLASITLTDSGSDNFQRTFIAAVTLAPVPEPGSAALLLAGGAAILLVRRRADRGTR